MRTILICLFIALNLYASQNFVKISSDKINYVKYEPIYLSVEYDSLLTPIGFPRKPIYDDMAGIRIVIEKDGNKSNYNHFVRASMPLDIENVDKHYITLLVNNGSVITGKSGKVKFYVIDKITELQISNVYTIIITEPSTSDEIQAMSIIERNLPSYSAFICFEGGDQFKEGKDILKELAQMSNNFGCVASLLLAINEATDFIPVGKPARRKSASKSFDYSRSNNSDKGPMYLKLRLCETWITQVASQQITKDMQDYIRSTVTINKKDLMRSSQFIRLKNDIK